VHVAEPLAQLSAGRSPVTSFSSRPWLVRRKAPPLCQ
jgi:hypothetical protein